MNVAVLASGQGSNLKALIEANKSGKLDARIVLVLSDKSETGAFETARQNDIATGHIVRPSFSSNNGFDQAVVALLREHEVDFIALAGYLRMISPSLVKHYTDRILNIHPALLPAFGGKGMYGRKVHEAVLEYGCKVSGATVHLVEEGYDTGPAVMQRCVPVLPADTTETLAARVLEVEHKIYPEALQLFAEKRVEIQGRKVTIHD